MDSREGYTQRKSQATSIEIAPYYFISKIKLKNERSRYSRLKKSKQFAGGSWCNSNQTRNNSGEMEGFKDEGKEVIDPVPRNVPIRDLGPRWRTNLHKNRVSQNTKLFENDGLQVECLEQTQTRKRTQNATSAIVTIKLELVPAQT